MVNPAFTSPAVARAVHQLAPLHLLIPLVRTEEGDHLCARPAVVETAEQLAAKLKLPALTRRLKIVELRTIHDAA